MKKDISKANKPETEFLKKWGGSAKRNKQIIDLNRKDQKPAYHISLWAQGKNVDGKSVSKANRFEVETTHKHDLSDPVKMVQLEDWKKQRRTYEKSPFPNKPKEDARFTKHKQNFKEKERAFGAKLKGTAGDITRAGIRAHIESNRPKQDSRPTVPKNRQEFFARSLRDFDWDLISKGNKESKELKNRALVFGSTDRKVNKERNLGSVDQKRSIAEIKGFTRYADERNRKTMPKGVTQKLKEFKSMSPGYMKDKRDLYELKGPKKPLP